MPADMQSETLPRRPVEDGEERRDEWVAAVEQVVSDAEAWATEQHWFVHRDPRTITDDDDGPYEVPSLLIQAPAGRFAHEASEQCGGDPSVSQRPAPQRKAQGRKNKPNDQNHVHGHSKSDRGVKRGDFRHRECAGGSQRENEPQSRETKH